MRRALGVAVIVAAVVAVATFPAAAHGGDPTLVPTVREISPALPIDVVVQARTTVSEQLLVANPTSTPLLVLDPAGVPFLRVSRAGAEGNVANPYFHRTLNPAGVRARVPTQARPGAEPRWVHLGKDDSWGWFEPRLHPLEPGTEPQGGSDVAAWQVGLRYGAQPVQVVGALERRTVTGSFFVQAEPRTDGLSVSIGQGSTPAVLLVAPPQQRVEVVGRDGRPFLRLDAAGVSANTASASFRDNPEFLAAAGQRQGWIRVGAPGRARWLDPRLQYSADRPPAVVERAGRPAQLGRWEIPVTVNGAAAPLQGTLSWLPVASALPAEGGDRLPWAPMAAGTAVVLAGIGLAVSRSRARPAAD